MGNGTASLPPQERQSWILNDAVVGIRIVGTSFDYLLAGRELYWIGRTQFHEQGAGSIVIDNPHVSDRHATIEQRNGRWIVFDRDSRNGIYVGDERRTMFELVPGLSFRIASIPLVAYSEGGRRARAQMQRYFGLGDGFQVTVEGVLRAAGERRHIALVEPPGGGALAVARAIHDASSRATWPFEVVSALGSERDQRKLLDRAAYGTIVIPAEALPARKAPIFDWLASWSHQVRLTVIVPPGTRLATVLPDALLTGATIIPIPTLAERTSELSALATHVRNDVCVRLGRMDLDLAPADLRGIEARAWPDNIRELETYVERLLALRAFPKQAHAAKWLGVVPSTLVAWKQKYHIA